MCRTGRSSGPLQPPTRNHADSSRNCRAATGSAGVNLRTRHVRSTAPDAATMSEVTENPLFSRVDHVGIAVPDLDAAIEFYRDGLRHRERPRRGQRRAGRARGDARRRRRHHPDPAARAAQRPVDDRQVHRSQWPRRAAARVHGHRYRGRQRAASGQRAAAVVRRAAIAAPPAAGSTSCTRRTPAGF